MNFNYNSNHKDETMKLEQNQNLLFNYIFQYENFTREWKNIDRTYISSQSIF